MNAKVQKRDYFKKLGKAEKAFVKNALKWIIP